MKKLLVFNHKMNLEYEEVFPYIDKLNKIETEQNIIVCPSNLYLADFMAHTSYGVGAQNVSYVLDGNYTGEISTLQLKSLGVEYAIIGHYERKKYFHETNKIINRKLNACLDANISPILCFGESGLIADVIADLDSLLEGISNIDFIIFAYEPLKISDHESTEAINSQIEVIYNYISEKYQSKPNLIYGGGILKKDIKELINNPLINGLMVGKISADIDKIEGIIKALD